MQEKSAECVHARERRPGLRIVGFHGSGALETPDCERGTLRGALIPSVQALEISFMSFGAHTGSQEVSFVLGGYCEPNLARDCAGDFSLDIEDIALIAIEVFRPQMRLVAGLDELGSYAKAAVGTADAAFEQVLNREFIRDLGAGLVRILVLHRRGPPDHAKVPRIQAAKRRDHLLGHAVGEIL